MGKVVRWELGIVMLEGGGSLERPVGGLPVAVYSHSVLYSRTKRSSPLQHPQRYGLYPLFFAS